MNPIEALEASGLQPIVVDENTDIGNEISKALRETNSEFIQRVMNVGCPTGGLVQPFIVEALVSYCINVKDSDGSDWPSNGFISYEAWKNTATWLLAELEAKYGPAR
jgi:hypothetical protein